MKLGHWKSMLISAAVSALCCVPAHAGWVTVSNSGTILTACNPKPFTTPTPSTCLLTGNTVLEALGTGAMLVSTNSTSIVANGVTVGTLYDRVYCYASSGTCVTTGPMANKRVLATRVQLIAGMWNGHNTQSFEVNDLIRQIVSGITTESAYWMGPDAGHCGDINSTDPDCGVANGKWVEYTGKTQTGLNDTPLTRDNNYIDHRNDANANDPDGVSSKWSAWVFVRQTCSSVSGPNTFIIKLWEGGEEAQDHYTQWMSGYQCS